MFFVPGNRPKKRTRRPKVEKPDPSKMAKTTVPCPSCDSPLNARQWGSDSLKRIEVSTNQGWVLIKQAGKSCSAGILSTFSLSIIVIYFSLSLVFFSLGSLNLPCLFCLAVHDDLTAEQWREVKLAPENLDDLKPKLRQHLDRAHRLSARNPECQAMISKAKQLMCPLLHDREPQEVCDILFWISPS